MVYFCNMKHVNNNRYFPPETFLEAFHALNLDLALETIGRSEEGRPVYALSIGSGEVKVLAWSQMHGNETTTTKALLDLLTFLETSPEGMRLKAGIGLRIIFQLNPDGAQRYTRVNANNEDLNRDAVNRTQRETQLLMREYSSYAPDYCLNLHGQRTIFAAGSTAKPAMLSFLAPSADEERSITPARKLAMQLIAALVEPLALSDEWGIGRYDDGFNINCVGDYFTAEGTPTLLFEAGHYPNDYNRDKTRKYIYLSLVNVLQSMVSKSYTSYSIEDYLAIPENVSHLRDVEYKNVMIVNNGGLTKSSLFVQYREELLNGEVIFVPEYAGNQEDWIGLTVIDLMQKNDKNPININESSVKISESLNSLL